MWDPYFLLFLKVKINKTDENCALHTRIFQKYIPRGNDLLYEKQKEIGN